MKKEKVINIVSVSVALIFIVISVLFHNRLDRLVNSVQSSADTVYLSRVDTHIVYKPQPSERIIVRCDTIEYLREVTKMVHDTIRIEIPVEQKIYRDTFYTAWVSGYKPQLDSIRIYNKVNTITVHTTQRVTDDRRWGFTVGVQTGLGYVAPFGKQPGVGMYGGLGFGVSYYF